MADDNQQGQMVHERLPSAASFSVTMGTMSIITSHTKTKQNQVVSAIESMANAANNSFATFLQQKQMSEEFEWKQRRLEMEEARAKHEEELQELQRKESRQQEQMNNVLQLAMTGMMVHMGMKKPGNNGDGNN